MRSRSPRGGKVLPRNLPSAAQSVSIREKSQLSSIQYSAVWLVGVAARVTTVARIKSEVKCMQLRVLAGVVYYFMFDCSSVRGGEHSAKKEEFRPPRSAAANKLTAVGWFCFG